MGKKGKSLSGNLGKALIRDRFSSSKIKRNADSSMLHTAEINDGYDWGRLNLNSVTEESSFQEFLSTAELAGTEFHAEKLNIKFVNPKSAIGLLSKHEKEKVLETQKQNKSHLKIPRRPKWDKSTTASELQAKEKENFLEWRHSLAILQETENLMLTPYEKNLEFWRQLWRVVERSDVVVQIVDARNPMIFRCEDLEYYVKEVDSKKMNMILINKADFLTDSQREAWAKYFTDINMKIAFFSATLASEKQKIEESINEDNLEEIEEVDEVDEANSTDCEESDNSEQSSYKSGFFSESEYESADDGNNMDCVNTNIKENECAETNKDECVLQDLKNSINEVSNGSNQTEDIKVENSAELLNREQLVVLFKTIYKGETQTPGVTTIGLVGYPNVGKSSTINALMMDKKVSVSATPGKTKHFQTLYLDKDLLLCDCPGLVMPSFVCTKAEMILNGILPIDRLQDHVPPVTLLGTLIPKHIIEDTYGIMIPLPLEGEDPDRPPTAEEILNAHAYNRGFMTQNGQPDNSRSSRYILKDFVNGKLLYCVAPPTLQQETFHKFPSRQKVLSETKHMPDRMLRANKAKTTSADVDKAFFQSNISGAHVRGSLRKMNDLSHSISQNAGTVSGSTQSLLLPEKPWKQFNKHKNKNKREKSRKLYSYLDQH